MSCFTTRTETRLPLRTRLLPNGEIDFKPRTAYTVILPPGKAPAGTGFPSAILLAISQPSVPCAAALMRAACSACIIRSASSSPDTLPIENDRATGSTALETTRDISREAAILSQTWLNVIRTSVTTILPKNILRGRGVCAVTERKLLGVPYIVVP